MYVDWSSYFALIGLQRLRLARSLAKIASPKSSVFLFLLEKMKSAREKVLGTFVDFYLVHFFVFFTHFLKNFLGQFEVFSCTFSYFFSV